MLERTSGFDAAIAGSPRHIFLRAVVDISDPDKVWLPVTGSPQAPWSHPEELHDKKFDVPPRYVTGEPGRWLLGGGFDLFPEDFQVPEHIGFVGQALSGPDGTFAVPQWVSLNFEGMSVLQACSVFFSTDPLDGRPVDFTVEVVQGNTVYFSKTITGNRAAAMSFDGFTVYNPDCIRVTVTRWSLPGRRVRMVEIIPGIYEDWDADMLEAFSVTQQGDFSCLTFPYGTAEIVIDNQNRRFEPRRKDGIFQSIQEKQGIELYIGVLLSSLGVEYKPVGMYYQGNGGWRTSQNDPTIRWSLVDICGLMAEWPFLVPETLPETLGGWIEAAVSQLGDSFKRRFRVDPEYAGIPVIANSREDVADKKNKDIVRWACMASGTWPRAGSETGALTVEPLWSQGAKLDLDNLTGYPAMKDNNKNYAALIFKLADGNNTEYVVSANGAGGKDPPTIINPFIHTREQALTAARLILAQCGGILYETTGRGNPASEIGDVDTIWLDESNATTARRMSQTFQIQDHALQGCQSKLLQADGSYLWTEIAIITESGTWKAPPNVFRLWIAAGQGGQGGGQGQDGQYISAGSSNISFSGYNSAYGADGVNGHGGLVWYGVIDINPEQEFETEIGQGGAPGAVYGEAGEEGQHTRFGAYSSENGLLYEDGYTSIINGQAFCRPGVEAPLPGTGDGGKGGAGGDPPQGYLEWVESSFRPPSSENRPGKPITGHYTWIETKPPGPGHPGAAGATGFVMIAWEKPKEALDG